MTVNQRANSGIAGDSLYTHLNTTGDHKKAEVSPYTGITFIYSLTVQVSDRMIKVLQDFFQATSMGQSFNASLAKVNKEVVIMDQFAPDTIPLPQIVVTGVPLDSVPLSFGNRLGKEEYNDHLYEIYGGDVDYNITLEIYDSGKMNTAKLADVVFLAMMQYVPTHMGATEMIVQPKVRFTNPAQVNPNVVQGSGSVFVIRQTVQVRAHWMQYMEIETVDTATIRSQETRT